uniref:Ig-like domain-containing protein n=1 Tax=Monopterus albus TaxID=43700 RepID=A0A3Q3K165_MONAL
YFLVYVLFSCLSSLAHTQAVPHQIPVTVANSSDDVTLTCPVYGDRAGLFYWYQVKCGYMVQIVAEGTFAKVTLKDQFDNSRFTVIRMGTQYHLNITNVQKEDEATYFCQSGSAYAMHFTEGTYLAVNDHNNQQKSVYVKQSPETVSTQLGGSVTLQCSLLSKSQENRVRCPGEHNVHWFRAGSGYSHPSVLYTHNDSGDEQEQRSCVYSLSKTVQDSDNGTYYCAVVTCGQILFGEGTKVEIRQVVWPFVTVLMTLLVYSIIVTAALIHSIKPKQVCGHDKGTVGHHVHMDWDDEPGAINYVALNFPSRKPKRWMNNREFPQDSVYSGMTEPSP